MHLKKKGKRFLIYLKSSFYTINNFSFQSYFKQRLFGKSVINVSIVSSLETLKTIRFHIQSELPGAYLRFGDGDVLLMIGSQDSYQKSSNKLSYEMREAFELNGSGIYKCLAIHSEKYGYDEGMEYGNHKNRDDLAYLLLSKTFQYFIGEKIYSPVALHFAASNSKKTAKEFLKILKIHTSLFIGNGNIKDDTIHKLFGEVNRVNTPSRNAYDKIDQIETECINMIDKKSKFQVIVIAMGCSGRILTKRLMHDNNNCFYFDFGSLIDGFEGDLSRKWLRMNSIDYKFLLNCEE